MACLEALRGLGHPLLHGIVDGVSQQRQPSCRVCPVGFLRLHHAVAFNNIEYGTTERQNDE